MINIYDYFEPSFIEISNEKAQEIDKKFETSNYIKRCVGSEIPRDLLKCHNFENWNTSTYELANFKNCVKSYIAKLQNHEFCNFLICGNEGTSKTFAATCIIQEVSKILKPYVKVIRQNINTKEFEEQELTEIKYYMCCYYKRMSILTSAIYGKTEKSQEMNKDCLESDLLILDDIGMSQYPKIEKELLFNIIDARTETRRPTVLISKLNPEDFKRFLGSGTVSRLMRNSVFFDTAGIPDMRLQ